ncbi:DUF6537 domain-containing protein [Leisingera sp. F5]|uniref:DUF6537 domain-containing protein n=1 Tax=Leisingera sp. F5 TaxID=1813816 RepID=UPI000AA967B0|nr:DUF6537 domain-containing protein [Leisingera sp. F5]
MEQIFSLHRDLLAWFEAALQTIASRYRPDAHEACLKVLKAPMDIRGYGPVRLKAAVGARAQAEDLLHNL